MNYLISDVMLDNLLNGEKKLDVKDTWFDRGMLKVNVDSV